MTLILHDYWRSSASFRVRIGLRLKGLAYETVPVNLLAGEQRGEAYHAVNPQRLVPYLQHNDVGIGQSLAILDYLDALQPEPRFVPRNAVDRARILAMALAVACDIHPLNNLRVLGYLKNEMGQDQETRDAWYAHWIREGLTALEEMAKAHGSGRGAGRFLFGDSPTLADICLIPQLYNARRFKVPIDDLSLLLAVEEAALAMDAFASAVPEAVEPV